MLTEIHKEGSKFYGTLYTVKEIRHSKQILECLEELREMFDTGKCDYCSFLCSFLCIRASYTRSSETVKQLLRCIFMKRLGNCCSYGVWVMENHPTFLNRIYCHEVDYLPGRKAWVESLIKEFKEICEMKKQLNKGEV